MKFSHATPPKNRQGQGVLRMWFLSRLPCPVQLFQSRPRACLGHPTLGCAAAAVARPCSARSPSRVASKLQEWLCQHSLTCRSRALDDKLKLGRIDWWRQFLSDGKAMGCSQRLDNSNPSAKTKGVMPWCMPDAQRLPALWTQDRTTITWPRGGHQGLVLFKGLLEPPPPWTGTACQAGATAMLEHLQDP